MQGIMSIITSALLLSYPSTTCPVNCLGPKHLPTTGGKVLLTQLAKHFTVQLIQSNSFHLAWNIISYLTYMYTYIATI